MKARLPQGFGKPDVNALMRQAQKMQEEMKAKQEELENTEYQASAGGGMVQITMTGKHEITSIKIDPEIVDKDDIESLMSFVESPPDNSTETTLFLNDIRRAVDTLDQPFKIPMALYLSGYKYQEIAEKMGIPLGTVKSRIHASRVQLQVTLKDFRK